MHTKYSLTADWTCWNLRRHIFTSRERAVRNTVMMLLKRKNIVKLHEIFSDLQFRQSQFGNLFFLFFTLYLLRPDYSWCYMFKKVHRISKGKWFYFIKPSISPFYRLIILAFNVKSQILKKNIRYVHFSGRFLKNL